jgi:hypothetical protein
VRLKARLSLVIALSLIGGACSSAPSPGAIWEDVGVSGPEISGWLHPGRLAAASGQVFSPARRSGGGYTVVQWSGGDWREMGTQFVREGCFETAVYSATDFNGSPVIGGSTSCRDTKYKYITGNGPFVSTFSEGGWTSLEPMWPPGQPNASVDALTTHDGQLVAAINGVKVDGQIKVWRGAAWHAVGDLESRLRTISALLGGERELIASGFATTYMTSSVLSWDRERWREIATGADGRISALLRYRGDLVVAGSFTSIGDTPVNRIARLQDGAAAPLGNGLNGEVDAAVVLGDDLIVAGRFQNAGDVEAATLARWDGQQWHSMDYAETLLRTTRSRNRRVGLSAGTSQRVTEPVTNLLVFNGELLTGGDSVKRWKSLNYYLLRAIDAGDAAKVDELLRRGASPASFRGSEDQNAMTLARARGHQQIVDLLERTPPR